MSSPFLDLGEGFTCEMVITGGGLKLSHPRDQGLVALTRTRQMSSVCTTSKESASGRLLGNRL